MNEKDDLVELHPPWRQAIATLAREGRTYGDLIPMEWLWEQFALEPLTDATPWSKAKNSQLLFLNQMREFTNHLLEDNQMALQNVVGKGYRIIPPKEQTVWAEREYIDDLRKALRRAGSRLGNVDFTALAARDRQENADALARLSKFKMLFRDQKRLRQQDDDEQSA
jgi:hypothetical protein